MGGLGYYDREGNPIDWRQWANMREAGSVIVAKEQLGDVEVSTVWLGIDHNFTDDGPPLIFETMIFPESEYCVRTPTREAALAAHDQAVEHVRSGDYAAEVREGTT